MVQPEGEYTERSGGLCGVVESAELGSVALPAPLHSELYARLGPNSIQNFWLEFWLEKPLEFWLEISLH